MSTNDIAKCVICHLQLSYAFMGLITIPTYGMFYSGILCPWMNGKVGVSPSDINVSV